MPIPLLSKPRRANDLGSCRSPSSLRSGGLLQPNSRSVGSQAEGSFRALSTGCVGEARPELMHSVVCGDSAWLHGPPADLLPSEAPPTASPDLSISFGRSDAQSSSTIGPDLCTRSLSLRTSSAFRTMALCEALSPTPRSSSPRAASRSGGPLSLSSASAVKLGASPVPSHAPSSVCPAPTSSYAALGNAGPLPSGAVLSASIVSPGEDQIEMLCAAPPSSAGPPELRACGFSPRAAPEAAPPPSGHGACSSALLRLRLSSRSRRSSSGGTKRELVSSYAAIRSSSSWIRGSSSASFACSRRSLRTMC
mmetsp:Transcript_31829/g.75565  ORF Transcript_31829/g.75565 Transcript_31829/m.75565 type:complete len:308 (+) Transcript_31829:537-1460(+)